MARCRQPGRHAKRGWRGGWAAALRASVVFDGRRGGWYNRKR
ncbi:MAG: hypothetical protein RMK49_18590 [Abditibacteriales bacterium]|nr:hypothetical protein [Abditibacteriales bacterium]